VSAACRGSPLTWSGRSSLGSSGVDPRRAARDRGVRGSRARVLQHEIDHLDGVLMLDRDARATAARRRCGRCGRAATYSPSAEEEPAEEDALAPATELRSRVPRDVGVRRPAVLGAWRTPPTGPRSSSRPPDSPRGRGARLAAPPAAEPPPSSGWTSTQTESVNLDRPSPRSGVPAGRSSASSALRPAHPGPVLSELELLNVHPSLRAAVEGGRAESSGAIMGRDARTGVVRSSGSPRVLDSGAGRAQEGDRESASARTSVALSAPARRARRARSACAPSTCASREPWSFNEQDDSRASYARKISPDERRLDPARSAIELERIVRALNPHIGAYLELEAGARLGCAPLPRERGGTRSRELGGGRDLAAAGLHAGATATGRPPASRQAADAGRRVSPRPPGALARCMNPGEPRPRSQRRVRGPAARVRARRVGGPRVPQCRRSPRPGPARASPGPAPRIRRGSTARNERRLITELAERPVTRLDAPVVAALRLGPLRAAVLRGDARPRCRGPGR
jgi:methionyl-tRNA formyltransferase